MGDIEKLGREAFKAAANRSRQALARNDGPIALREKRWMPSWPILFSTAIVLTTLAIVVGTGALKTPSYADTSVPVQSRPTSDASSQNSEETSNDSGEGGGAGASHPGGKTVKVHVVGQVKMPGLISVSADARVDDAIRAAGGATDKADLSRINVARHVSDGEQIYVPALGEENTTGPPENSPGTSRDTQGAGRGSGGVSPASKININSANTRTLQALPGVGPALAQRIVDYRNQHGRFQTVDALDNVPGIGPALLEKLRPYVQV